MPDGGWFGTATERLRRLREQAADIVAETRAKEEKLRASWGREVREAERGRVTGGRP